MSQLASLCGKANTNTIPGYLHSPQFVHLHCRYTANSALPSLSANVRSASLYLASWEAAHATIDPRRLSAAKSDLILNPSS